MQINTRVFSSTDGKITQITEDLIEIKTDDYFVEYSNILTILSQVGNIIKKNQIIELCTTAPLDIQIYRKDKLNNKIFFNIPFTLIENNYFKEREERRVADKLEELECMQILRDKENFITITHIGVKKIISLKNYSITIN